MAAEHLDAMSSLLLQLLDKESKDFQIQMIAIVIKDYLYSIGENFENVLHSILAALENEDYNVSVIEKIGLLATALDLECDYAFSRIQGR